MRRGHGGVGAWLLGLLAGLAPAADADTAALPPGGRYTLTTQTVMPHLEENLRYATTHASRCLQAGDPAALFPVLASASLRGCMLGAAQRDEDGLRFVLSCDSEAVASGEARLRGGAGRLHAVLEVRMGGKNMTFSQRVTARRSGDCVAARPATP